MQVFLTDFCGYCRVFVSSCYLVSDLPGREIEPELGQVDAVAGVDPGGVLPQPEIDDPADISYLPQILRSENHGLLGTQGHGPPPFSK